MTEELKPQYQQVKDIVEQQFVENLFQRCENHQRFLIKTKEHFQKIKSINREMSPEKAFKLAADYKKALLEHVEEYYSGFKKVNFDVEFSDYLSELISYVKTLEESISRDQEVERYEKQKDDSLILKIGKWFKRQFRSISYWPVRTGNFFRKLFKKQTRELVPKRHNIHFRQLSDYYLRGQLSVDLVKVVGVFYEKISSSSCLIWQMDEEIDHILDKYCHDDCEVTIDPDFFEKADEISLGLETVKEELKQQVNLVYEEIFDKYCEAYRKCGTIELSNRSFSKSRVDHVVKKANHDYQLLTLGWSNTLLALSDDWEIDIELYAIIYRGQYEFYRSEKSMQHKINDNILLSTNKIKQFLTDLEQEITEHKGKKDLKKHLENTLEKSKSDLGDSFTEPAMELILAQNLPAYVNAVEATISKMISTISAHRAIVKGIGFDKPLKSSAINFISPAELINFESFPQLQKVVQQIKIDVTSAVNEAQQSVMQLDQIVRFNLESAISIYSEPGSTNDPFDVAIEGLQRTKNKVEEIENLLTDIPKLLRENLLIGLEKFNNSLIHLTSNENIFDIRVRIAKGKAMERGKRLKEKWITFFKNILPLSWSFIKTNYIKGDAFVKGLFKKYGLTKDSEAISTEIADFLAETQTALEKLPFVYQRLFNTEPLTDANLFVGRKAEKQLLIHAYNNWMKDRFAATVVVGEKGSGITSLLNFYLQDLSTSSNVNRMSSLVNISSTSELLEFFEKHFDHKFNTMAEVVKFLNENGKRIVILENIQKLYLKKVGGFECLQQLTELISLTSKNVFWVTTCTLYGWTYLNKTMRIGEHFGYEIMLKEFDDDSIVNIVTNRHQVSGYNMGFLPSSIHLNNKKFKKLKTSEQQQILKKEFFGDLNRIAKSNISLALIYWLRSTKEVSQNTISIGSLKEMNFSFLDSLPYDKLLALNILLLHDGLTEEDFVKVLGGSLNKTRNLIHPLYEDGIIVLINRIYYINPLLYRQSVSLLKSKNILH